MIATLPETLYSCKQVRQIDAFAIQSLGIPGSVLMKRAGRAAFEFACSRFPANHHWVVWCGAGNNAGDGYVFAALAAQRSFKVDIVYLKDPETLQGDALSAYRYAKQENVSMEPFNPQKAYEFDDAVMIDAVLGTGISGCVTGEFATAIERMNQAGCPVLSLDIPSGLCGDTGVTLGVAVNAMATMTFVGCKKGLLTGRGSSLVGDLVFSDLDIPKEAYDSISTPTVGRLSLGGCTASLQERQADAHKGDAGHVMVIGGDLGFGGAAILAAEAAAYSGAGMVSLFTRSEHVAPALCRRPELMVRGIPSGQELEPFLPQADIIVIGPGLGKTPWSEQMLQQAIASGKPLILDADALNILALGRIPWPTQPCLITPHPGEAARLLSCATLDIQQDRFGAADKLRVVSGGVVVLKGAGTLIQSGDQAWLANVGNAGLATAGSGDVLAGLIGGLAAQGMTLENAAKLAVCVHGDAADLLVAEVGIRGMLAAELLPYVRELLSVE